MSEGVTTKLRLQSTQPQSSPIGTKSLTEPERAHQMAIRAQKPKGAIHVEIAYPNSNILGARLCRSHATVPDLRGRDLYAHTPARVQYILWHARNPLNLALRPSALLRRGVEPQPKHIPSTSDGCHRRKPVRDDAHMELGGHGIPTALARNLWEQCHRGYLAKYLWFSSFRNVSDRLLRGTSFEGLSARRQKPQDPHTMNCARASWRGAIPRAAWHPRRRRVASPIPRVRAISRPRS